MSLELGYSTNLSVPAPAEEQEHYRPGQHQRSARPVRRVQPAKEPTESAARRAPVGGTGGTSARSMQPGNPREPGIFLEIVGDSKVKSGESASHSVSYIILKNDYYCRRAQFCKDVGRSRNNDLASSRNGSSHEACRDAPSRADA